MQEIIIIYDSGEPLPQKGLLDTSQLPLCSPLVYFVIQDPISLSSNFYANGFFLT